MTAPGWYQDPEGAPGQTRWWDGEQWAARAIPTAAPAPPTPGQSYAPMQQWYGQQPKPPPSGGAYVLGGAFPIVGLIWGIVCFSRNQVGPGFGMFGAAFLGVIVYIVYIGYSGQSPY